MVDKKSKFKYCRSLKLGPAVGDWTTIQFRDPGLEEIHVSQIQHVNFDSLPREDLKLLHYLHYRIAEKMVEKFSVDMDIKIELHTIVATQMSYEDYLKSQEERLVQADYMVQSMGTVNVVFGWDLADMMVNRLVGGKGESSEASEFSDVELIVLEAQMESLIDPFHLVWKSVFSKEDVRMSFNAGGYKHDSKVSLREAYITFAVYMYFGKGDLRKLTWAYPSSVVRQLLKQKKQLPDPIKYRVDLSKKTLANMNVDVTAILGCANLTMGELRQLQSGDVIPLDSRFDQPLKIFLGDQAELFAQPGIFNNKVSLQVIVPDGDDNIVLPMEVNKNSLEDAVAGSQPIVELPKEVPLSTSGSKGKSNIEDNFSEGVDDVTEDPFEQEPGPSQIDIPMESQDEEAALKNDVSDDDFENAEKFVDNSDEALDSDTKVDAKKSANDDDEVGDVSDDFDDDFSWDEIEDL